MPLVEIRADLAQVVAQLKRIADLLDDWLHPPPPEPLGRGRVEVTRADVRGRWEAEREDRRLRQLDEEAAGVTPRR